MGNVNLGNVNIYDNEALKIHNTLKILIKKKFVVSVLEMSQRQLKECYEK